MINGKQMREDLERPQLTDSIISKCKVKEYFKRDLQH